MEDFAEGRVAAEDVLADTIRILVQVRNERAARMATLLATIEANRDAIPLSSEAIVKLLEQHLACTNSSRLPVLMVAAAYQAAAGKLGEYARPLEAPPLWPGQETGPPPRPKVSRLF